MSAPPPYPSYDNTFDYGQNMNQPQAPISREDKYRGIVNKHEISLDFAQRLQQLQGFKIVFIFDDSGSMNAPLIDSPLNNDKSLLKATRWDELQYFAKISVEIATLFDTEGCSVYFLNKQPSPIKNIKDEYQVEQLFRDRPQGFTPLPRVLDQVLNDNGMYLNEKKLLVVIVTDGEPTDDRGVSAIPQFKKILQKRHPKVYTTIVACTDDDESVEYLNKWDRELMNLDVVDDFRNERTEIRQVKGRNFPFSFGDYVVKSLIGSIDRELDNMDENKSGCCSIV